jgi:hypothetical protein
MRAAFGFTTDVAREQACGEKNGAGEGTRTPDPIITNDVLYQLSYTGILLGRGLALSTARDSCVALICAAGDLVQGEWLGRVQGLLRRLWA